MCVCVIREREGMIERQSKRVLKRERQREIAEWRRKSSRCSLCVEVMEVGVDGCRSPAAPPNNSA